MKKRELENMRKLSKIELTKKVDELRKRAILGKSDFYAGKVSDYKEVKKMKRDISQLLTIIAELGRKEQK